MLDPNLTKQGRSQLQYYLNTNAPREALNLTKTPSTPPKYSVVYLNLDSP